MLGSKGAKTEHLTVKIQPSQGHRLWIPLLKLYSWVCDKIENIVIDGKDSDFLDN